MATLTAEQIEQKKQLLEEKMMEAKVIYDELADAGAIELSDDDLDQAAGGGLGGVNPNPGGGPNYFPGSTPIFGSEDSQRPSIIF